MKNPIDAVRDGGYATARWSDSTQVKTKTTFFLSLATAMAVLIAGCGTNGDDSATTQQQSGGNVEDLGGTAWQLVAIRSMDDSIHKPHDASFYTLTFGTDGTALVLADCNRGTGSWSSSGPSQLEFGVIAATQAMCSPSSLHDQYMSQFEWVRSFQIADGHLFLATMADGSIIEFQPLDQ